MVEPERKQGIMTQESANRFIHKKCSSAEVERTGGFSISPPDGGEEVCCLYYCNKCGDYYLDCHHTGVQVKDSYTYQREIGRAETEKVKEAFSGCADLYSGDCVCEYHRNLERIVFKR